MAQIYKIPLPHCVWDPEQPLYYCYYSYVPMNKAIYIAKIDFNKNKLK